MGNQDHTCFSFEEKNKILSHFSLISLGDAVLLREKLLSITSHLTNKHTFTENSQYKACSHGEVEATDEKPWLEEDSLVNLFP